MKRRVGQNKVLLLDKSGHPKTWDWIYLLLRLISLTISFYISQVRDIFCQKKICYENLRKYKRKKFCFPSSYEKYVKLMGPK